MLSTSMDCHRNQRTLTHCECASCSGDALPHCAYASCPRWHSQLASFSLHPVPRGHSCNCSRVGGACDTVRCSLRTQGKCGACHTNSILTYCCRACFCRTILCTHAPPCPVAFPSSSQRRPFPSRAALSALAVAAVALSCSTFARASAFFLSSFFRASSSKLFRCRRASPDLGPVCPSFSRLASASRWPASSASVRPARPH